MSNFELIDDYLSNRLKGAERETFEKQLNNDPALKSDLDFQKQIVEGIRTARAAELKNMLSKVPVGGTTISMDFSVVRMAAGLIAAGVVGAAIYFYSTRGELPPFDKAAGDLNKKTEEIEKQEPKQQEEAPAVKEDEKKEEPRKEESSKPAVEKKKEEIKPAEKPKLDVANPTDELENNDDAKKNEPTASVRRSDITPSNIQVDLDSSNKKYSFHYQFVDSKLMLYGSFDKSLYEVLEINGDNHAVFLFYKDAYYLLDENQTKVTKLEPITDAALLGKLKEYRKR
ncbi:MAG TPA: hypothetical protein VFE50_04265 [Cyclobacteriaceae bacterium]|nr:hypothetical protein [Cyclobacteriaceae bacterium]